MSMYVLVEFDNDDQAQRLVDAMQGKKAFRVVGLFKKPTKFCECPPMTDLQQSREVALGERFGWRVHRKCRRARKAPQAPRNLLESGPQSKHDFFLHLTPNYPLQVHNVSPRSS